MTPDELYRALSLESLSTTSLQAQIPSGVDPRNTECNAHVEFQLTPNGVEGATPPQYALQIRLTCTGTPARGNPRTRLFELEIKALALYRQTGIAVSLNDFTSNHTVLARQLFPLLASRAQDLLERLGLHAIRLPLDLPQEMSVPQGAVSATLN